MYVMYIYTYIHILHIYLPCQFFSWSSSPSLSEVVPSFRGDRGIGDVRSALVQHITGTFFAGDSYKQYIL
jgi:hypothetical protein